MGGKHSGRFVQMLTGGPLQHLLFPLRSVRKRGFLRLTQNDLNNRLPHSQKPISVCLPCSVFVTMEPVKTNGLSNRIVLLPKKLLPDNALLLTGRARIRKRTRVSGSGTACHPQKASS